jgi:hypothetical protein
MFRHAVAAIEVGWFGTLVAAFKSHAASLSSAATN